MSLLDPVAGVCSSVCKKAAVCATAGKLGSAQLGAAQPRTELTAPVPSSLHFKYVTRDNRWIETGADENSGIPDSLKSQLLTRSLILPNLKFHSLTVTGEFTLLFLTEEEEQ